MRDGAHSQRAQAGDEAPAGNAARYCLISCFTESSPPYPPRRVLAITRTVAIFALVSRQTTTARAIGKALDIAVLRRSTDSPELSAALPFDPGGEHV